jgi:predicted ATP-grasp superfamily ATP-dependent carboligase
MPSTAWDRSSGSRFDALVLDADLRQSLVTVRSLGRRNVSVAALGVSNDLPAFSSRWCNQKYTCPSAESYLDTLERLLNETSIGVLIPSADSTIALLRCHRNRLQQQARIAIADEAALAIAVDKEQTLSLAARLGIQVPRTIPVAVGDLPAALKTIGLPAVVKPNESWLEHAGHGIRVVCQVVTTMEEAKHAVAALTNLGGVPLLQPLLSGRREAVSLMFAKGRVYARFAQWAKRTSPPLGGESVLRQSIAIPADIGRGAERLIREIGLDGYSEVEFRRDSRGVPCLMEVNPRLSASVEVAVRSGVDFPYLIYQWASGAPIDEVKSYQVGGWMRHLRGDIMTTLEAVRRRGRPEVPPPLRALVSFGTSFFTPVGYDYLDWTDPLPAVKATSEFVREAARVAVRSALRSRTVS